MYRCMELVDGENVYPLSDCNRNLTPGVAPAWEDIRRGIDGALSITRGAIKRIWSLDWTALHVDSPEDGGVGADQLQALYTAGKTYTLRVYTSETTYNSYTVAITKYDRRLVPYSRRERYDVSMELQEC